MKEEINLIEHFKIPGISQHELLCYFQQGDSYAENGVYSFLADQVKVQFNKKGKIKSIIGSADSVFVKNAIKELTTLSKETEFKIARIVVEGISPLVGFYKYNDLFQISPLKSIPKHIDLGKSNFPFPFPFLIEYKYRTSKNIRISSIRQQNAKNDILPILNLLIYGGISDINTNTNNSIWTQTPKEWREPTEDEIEMLCDYKHPENWERINMYLSPGFRLEDIDINQEQFAKTDGITPIELIDHKKYYQKLGVSTDDYINLPSIIGLYLDTYYGLYEKEKFQRALYWLLKHHETWRISKSISFNCLIQSIEVLMDSKRNTQQCQEEECNNTKILNDSCKKCSSPITGIGPTQAFRDFVETYAGNIPVNIKNELYSLRSSISHGSLILEMDSNNLSSFDAKSHNQRRLMDIGREIVVLCLLNWMMSTK